MLIDEFARWTADELDYLLEARQSVLLHEHAQGETLERIARVYRGYTTSRVLTTELIEGIPLIEIVQRRAHAATPRTWTSCGRAATTWSRSFATSIGTC